MDTLGMNVLCSQHSLIYHLCPKEDRWDCAFTDTDFGVGILRVLTVPARVISVP